MSHPITRLALGAAAILLATQAMAQITFYEGERFTGRALTINGQEGHLGREGFNDRASSVIVDRGRWEVCEHDRFEGRCVILRRGNYESLRPFGMEYRISSVRPVGEHGRYANEYAPPVATPEYGWRRRPHEHVFEVPVSSVRAVVGPPSQRCWVERQQVSPPGSPNVGGAVVGGLIGGILGHQVGGGSGKDLATIGGAVAGAAIGANSGGGSTQPGSYADVQRCQTVPSTAASFYDVTYFFRGIEHHVQMTAPPGRMILVNEGGEPRV